MNLSLYIKQYLRDLYILITSDVLKNKLYMFFFYNYLVLKNLISKIFRIDFKSQNFLGFNIVFDNFHAFFAIFTEIFIYNIYNFKTNKKNPFIIDCGGNIGMAVIYFKYLYPNSKIECYEPDPITFTILNKNIKENNLKDVKLIQKAISGTTGTATFYSQSDVKGGPGNSLLKSQATFENVKEYKVELVRLLKENYTEIDYLKIDIEGAEGSLFKDLKKTEFLSIVKNLNLEYHYDLAIKDNLMSSIISVIEGAKFSYIINQNALVTIYTSRKQYEYLGEKYVLIIDCFKK